MNEWKGCFTKNGLLRAFYLLLFLLIRKVMTNKAIIYEMFCLMQEVHLKGLLQKKQIMSQAHVRQEQKKDSIQPQHQEAHVRGWLTH